MTTTMSIRELTRSGSKIADYDYIDIEDRKSHEYKGVLISAKYADEVKRFLEKKLAKEKQERIDEIMQYVGTVKIQDRFADKNMREIREMIAKEKHGE
jgi:hypothetical protein